jgi:hypothetical protein
MPAAGVLKQRLCCVVYPLCCQLQAVSMNDSYLNDEDYSGVQSEDDIKRILKDAQTPGPNKYNFDNAGHEVRHKDSAYSSLRHPTHGSGRQAWERPTHVGGRSCWGWAWVFEMPIPVLMHRLQVAV